MASGYIIRDQKAAHFITLTVVDWVDVFTRRVYRDILLESLIYCQQKKGMILWGYVIMSNHMHLIVKSDLGPLSELVRDFKKFTAQRILKTLTEPGESRSDWMLKRFAFAARHNSKNSSYHFWQSHVHAEEIYSDKFFWTKLNYIHMNPVKAGIVAIASDCLYSSAANYVGKQNLMPVTVVPLPPVNMLNKMGVEMTLW